MQDEMNGDTHKKESQSSDSTLFYKIVKQQTPTALVKDASNEIYAGSKGVL